MLTDITEHPTAEGKLYLWAIKDACSKRIVGYSIGARMTADVAVTWPTPRAARRRRHDRALGPRQPLPQQDVPMSR